MTENDNKSAEKPNFKLYLRIFWGLFITGVVSVIMLFVLLKNGTQVQEVPLEKAELVWKDGANELAIEQSSLPLTFNEYKQFF